MNPGPERLRRVWTALPALLVCASLLVAPGCGKKKAPPPPPPPPPPPAAPVPVNVGSMLTDPKVQFAESAAPTEESIARSAIAFAKALAHGDASAVEPMLDPLAKETLANLRASGAWSRATTDVEAVRIVTLTSAGDGYTLAIAVKPKGEPAYLTGWRARPTDSGGWVFAGAPTSVKTAASLAELDGDTP